ncbi:cellulase family glycosylhydrolase [Kutzneria sp. CA-103260]|uniref:cellulase family glycosylhydrolase n=1 Tax=Kutzneria sp. CA-103260 TaxID=2802641 RepID=UPI001BAE2F48|nr:cellulase family glycosylhydrolase [Kutzneria sp. CA-103260]QUQ65476.1 Carbohydrate binding domain protein [Kutzneria sp. CA-103260]
MRRLRWPASVLLTLVAATSLSVGPAAAATRSVPADPMAAVAAMQPSWNLGNTLDAIPDETSWGNPLVTKQLFDTVRANGFHSVRIPVTWSGHQSATAPYAIDAKFLTRVRQVVGWALSDGLYVELNVHHDSWQWIATMAADHDGVLARYNATWTQIAAAFRDEPRSLLFESVNEPQFTNATDAQKTQFLNELNTSFHTIVRGSGGGNATRLLVLPTLGCTPDQILMDNLATEMASLHDHNLVATVHYYGYWPFSVNIAGYTRFETTSQQDMAAAFTRMRNTFVSKGIPVYLGEYGLLSYPDYTHPDAVERGEAVKYFEQLGYEARTSGVTAALWDAGSFLNRDTFQWRDPGLVAEIRSSWTTRSGTAAADTIYVPKANPIAAQTLALSPNGTTFTGLWQGNTALVAGRDYTLAGNQLTLTAAALTRLVGNRAYGVDATLQARFSHGTPWSVDISTYDPPVLSNASGTTSSFAVPTQFRGDRLATMEAKYVDGSNAGPANWTSYQQFTTAFSPGYPAGAIALTADFFNATNDNAPVTLTFHFWSGATATYHVTKSGSSVVGVVS